MNRSLAITGTLCIPIILSGCTLTADQLLEEIRLHEKRKTDNTLAMTKNIFNKLKLSEDVQKSSQDIVSEAYMRSRSKYERNMIVHIAAFNEHGQGRYIPFLYYIATTDSQLKNRVTAACAFGALKQMNPHIPRSEIVLALGNIAESAGDHQEECYYYLEHFLFQICEFSIPNADRKERVIKKKLRKYSMNWTVEAGDPAVVKTWWEKDGKTMALEKRFDQ